MMDELMDQTTHSHVTHHLYRHFDAAGVLLYVGVSFSAFARLAQHREASHWYSDIASMTIEKFLSRAELLDAESEAIQSERPLHNIIYANYKRPPPSARATEAKFALIRHVTFKPVFSVKEAAECLQISGARIRALVAAGRLGTINFKDGFKERMLISGWHLIDFLESISEEARDQEGSP